MPVTIKVNALAGTVLSHHKMNSKIIALFGLCFIFTTVIRQGNGEEKKKFKVILDKLVKEKDAEHIVDTQITFDRESEAHEVLVNGYVETHLDIDDNYKLNIEILHSDTADGEKTKLIGVSDKGVCVMMKTHFKHFFYETMKNHGNVPDPDACPVPKNKYTVSKYPLDTSKFAQFIRGGYYHVMCTLVHNGAEVLVYRIEAHTQEE